ncbi:hypothetical protein WJ66_03642, partial [Stenotrophomonas maltophilia WJ66]
GFLLLLGLELVLRPLL